MVSHKITGLFLISFLVFSFIFAQVALADGMIYHYKPDYQYWQLQSEDQQLAAINYEDGFENLMITVDVSEFQSTQGVWIFPVPSKPHDTVIDIVKAFPRLSGYDVKQKTDRSISDTFDIMRLSQVYTLPLYMISGFSAMGTSTSIEQKTTAALDLGVTVHEHIEKMGLITELITAESGEGFYTYLTDKGLVLPEEAKGILEDYIGEDYTFVVSWISDERNYTASLDMGYGSRGIASTLGVHVTFPTDKIYMPLKPTSIYGSEEIPIKVYIIGHVTPELYTKI
jgi:hypothetical protein